MIGAHGAYGDARGLVYEYTDDAVDGWPAAPTVTFTAPNGNRFFGNTGIAVSGTTALIGGAFLDDTEGVVYAYSNTNSGVPGTWSTRPVAAFHDPAPGLHNSYGNADAVSGGTAIVGAPGVKGARGRVYVYRANRQGVWPATPTIGLADPTGTKGDQFGWAAGLSGHTALIGERGANGSSGLAVLAHV
jgi:hypothetical protein